MDSSCSKCVLQVLLIYIWILNLGSRHCKYSRLVIYIGINATWSFLKVRILKVRYSLQIRAAISYIWTDDSSLKVIPTIDIPLVLEIVPPDPLSQPIVPLSQQGLEPSAPWPRAMPFPDQPFQPQPGFIPYSMPQSFPPPKSSTYWSRPRVPPPN